MDICNSWYLYNLECYQTSCNSCNEHFMSYTISYMWCNSHATICNFFVINLHSKFSHIPTWWTKCQHGMSSICWQMMYVNAFCNYFTTSLTNIILNYFIHPFVKWILFLYFTISSTNIFFHFFIHPFDVNEFYPNPLQLVYNYFIISLMNIF
jgi:hypothetical protein